MLSIIDKKLFSDTINLAELPNGMVVYPIHKNGSTTINHIKTSSIGIEQVKDTDVVDVFIREPYTRFLCPNVC
jgi:hypothetical protein